MAARRPRLGANVTEPRSVQRLGTLLIMLLAQVAAERGVHTFSASYLAGNRPVAALVEDAGGVSRQVIKQGIAEVSLAFAHRPLTGDAHGATT